MAGSVTDHGIDTNTQFENRHLLCDWLLCPFIHDLHIFYVAIYYDTCTMRHEDSKCRIHDSERIFLGIETFMRDHIIWRQTHDLSLCRIEAMLTTTAYQADGVCGNATCKVHCMPGLSCGRSYVPLYNVGYLFPYNII